MTAGSGGIRVWRVDCRYCGRIYTLTNWMSLGEYDSYIGLDGKRVEDKHQRACERKVRAVMEGAS